MHGLAVYVKERLLFTLKTLQIFIVFNRAYLIRFLTSFFSFNHFLHLCARLLILFHLTKVSFSQLTHLLMYLSVETLDLEAKLFWWDW